MSLKRIIPYAILFSIITLMAHAQYQFTRITEGPHVTDIGSSGGINWIDYDNDGYQDIFACMFDSNNRLYHNNGDGSFSAVTEGVLVSEGNTNSSSWGDFNNDGYIDVYATVGRHQAANNYLYQNNGDGSFTKIFNDTTVQDENPSFTSALADYNNDGNIDIFVADQGLMPPAGPCYDQLYSGLGDGHFNKITGIDPVTDPVHSCGISWADYDDDGDQDLFVLKNAQANVLFLNNGGTFEREDGTNFLSDIPASCFCWGDYDNDGDLDLYVTNFNNGPANSLYMNTGTGIFTTVTGQDIMTDPGWSSGAICEDFDNDGDLDIYVTNADPSGPSSDCLYRNDGSGTFAPVIDSLFVDESVTAGMIASADYDRDGDIDLFLAHWDDNSLNALYRNNGNSYKWIDIKCTGTTSNRSAIGARIRLKADIFGSKIWQMREISSRNGYLSQNSLNVHFGLGDASIIDSITIEWPSGMVDVYTDVTPNQFLTYTETLCGDADGNFNVNILDITFLISYLYKGGPAPQHMQAADPDGNGTTNILDITYLIAYLYKGGMKPVCQ